MSKSAVASSSSPLDENFRGAPILARLPTLPHIPGVDPARNPYDAFRSAIAVQVAASLGIEDVHAVFLGVQPTNKGGDFNLAVPRFRLPGKPDQHAKKIVDEFKPDAYIESAKQNGAFVLFTVSTPTLVQLTLSTIHVMSQHVDSAASSKPDANPNGSGTGTAASSSSSPSSSSTMGWRQAYGANDSGRGKRMLVEFSSPNIAKPFHAGHLRSTIIGAFLANLFEANGWYVERWNYLGDWGKQFGLLAIGWEMFGKEKELEKDAVKHLYDVYVEVNKRAEVEPEIHERARAHFKSMEDGDESALATWRKFRQLSIQKYEQTYARLNIRFDRYSGESQVSKESVQHALDSVKSSSFCEKAENGAYLVDLTKYKMDKAVIERKDGTPLYITRDVGEARQRWDDFEKRFGAGFDRMIYVVASQQDLHLAQFFKVLELMGYGWAQPSEGRLQHVNFGMVLGMSTRKGTAVFLDHILDETKENMHAVMRTNEAKYSALEDPERTADEVGMSAVKIQDMQGKRINNYQFDWQRMLSFEGDTGPYLQYNHVRLCSVERKVAADDGVKLPEVIEDPASELGLECLSEPKARELAFLLASWPDVVKTASKDLQPSTVVSFCFRLTHTISSAWEVLLVKGQERRLALARLFMYRCARQVLASALRLLTIVPLDRM